MSDLAPPKRVPKTISRSVMRARVEEAAALMRTMSYVRGVTDRELAARWGIGLAGAQRYTSEASRVVAAEVRDPDAVTTDVGTFVASVVRDSGEETRDRLKAAELWSKIAGTFAPDKLEHSQANPVVLTADWAAFRVVLLEALRPYPEAHAAVVEAIRAYTAGRQ
jgi:hypothetical protein